MKSPSPIIVPLLAVLFTAAVPSARAQDGKAIVDALVRKGILTQGDAEQLIQDAAKSSAAAQVVPNAKATTKLAIGARLQVQFDGLSTGVTNGPAPAPTNHFAIRRTYIVLKGNLGSDKQIDITYDFAAGSFDAAYLNWKRSDSIAFDFGLRKVNFAVEEKLSSGSLKAIERSAATRYFVEDNNGRRLGAGSYRLGVYAEGTPGNLFWSAAITNPERASTAGSLGTAANNTPALWAGAGVRGNFTGGTFLIGANFGALPDQGGRTVGTGNDLNVGSLNAEITAGKFTVVAEYLASRNDRGSAAGRDADSWGLYVMPSFRFDKHWEGVARYSYVDTDGRGITLADGLRSAASGGTMDKLSEYYFGFTYYVAGNDLKFQAGYVHGRTDDTLAGGSAKATSSGVRSQIQMQF